MNSATAADTVSRPIVYQPRGAAASHQDSLPQRYGWAVHVLSMAAFTLAFVGWLNDSWLYLFDNPIWLNRYTEYALIMAFGVWRVVAERNPYTRKRLAVLVFMVTVFWWLIPWLVPVFEPYVGYLWQQPVFPSLHVPGTVTFFLVLGAVFLFGRRVICGWNCPCVGVREVVGFPYRRKTLRSKWAWRLRHTKWLFFVYYVGVMVVTQYSPNAWTVSFVSMFYLVVTLTYFGTFFIAPLTGNRFYCRYLCPYGATFGLLNHAGFYDIRMDAERCIDCRRCDQVCDMGIPVWEQGKAHGRITGIEDCMGCGRCVVSCPTDALEIRDVRNLLRPRLVQNASHLLKKAPAVTTPRREPELRPAVERRNDGREIVLAPEAAALQAQAARCLDCGVPGCRNACPLRNRIPDWLRATARGDFKTAAHIAHDTNPLPEVCGRLCPQHRLCEGACTRTREDGAVTIGAVERFATEHAFSQGWQPPLAPARRTGKAVAVVGAGPAGLACAERLNRAGVSVTVYDKASAVGGLLSSGVPSFKLDKSVLAQRAALLEQAGIDFRLGIEVDAALFGRILAEHDAVFLGTGAQAPRPVALPGAELPGVYQALDFLSAVNGRKAPALAGQRVLVLGGGDTAMDGARCALRQGAGSVQVVYRGAEAAMSAGPKERQAARDEGIGFLFEQRPVAILGGQRVSGARFATDRGERHEACDVVLLAFGFVPQPPLWLAAYGINVDEQGRVITDNHGRTSHAEVFAGGDNVDGPRLVVTALAGGRRAADAILDGFSLAGRTRALLPGSRAGVPLSAEPLAARQSEVLP